MEKNCEIHFGTLIFFLAQKKFSFYTFFFFVNIYFENFQLYFFEFLSRQELSRYTSALKVRRLRATRT